MRRKWSELALFSFGFLGALSASVCGGGAAETDSKSHDAAAKTAGDKDSSAAPPLWLQELRAARRLKNSNPLAALMIFKKAFADAMVANAPVKDRLNIAMDIGETQFSEGSLIDAIASYKRGEEIAVSENRKDWQAAFLGRIGLAEGFAYAWGMLNNKPNPQSVLKALELRPGDPKVPTSFRAMCYQALGQIYLESDDLANAEKYIDLGIAECSQLGNEQDRGDGLRCQKAVLLVKQGKMRDGFKLVSNLISEDAANAPQFSRRFKQALEALDESGKDTRRRVRDDLAKADYSDLDKLAGELNAQTQTYASGRLPVSSFISAFEVGAGETESVWQKRIDQIKAWIKQNPKSAYAKVVLGDLLCSYAWKARGSGYAESISISGGRSFEDRLKESLDVLVTVSPEDRPSSWYRVAQRVALGQGWTRSHYDQMIAECLKKYPDDLGVLFNKIYFLEPRWYGKEGELPKFIGECVDKKSGADADVLYARLWWSIDDIIGGIVDDESCNYDRVVKGMHEICERYPKSWKARAELFYLAARKGDKAQIESIPMNSD